MEKRLVIILPDHDFDVSETTLPWSILTKNNIEVHFATETGKVAECDPKLLTGHRLFGFIQAPIEVRNLYKELQKDERYQHPITWTDLDLNQFDGVIVPGGHAQGVRQMLESDALKKKIAQWWPNVESNNKVCGAVCHGVLLLVRTINESTGRSILYEKKTTCLPSHMENMACRTTWIVLGDYYRTYPGTTVEEETRKALKKDEEQFQRGPLNLFGDKKQKAFYVEDGNYLSARWPGDVPEWSQRIADKINNKN